VSELREIPNLLVWGKEVKDSNENINVTANDIVKSLVECAILFCFNCELIKQNYSGMQAQL